MCPHYSTGVHASTARTPVACAMTTIHIRHDGREIHRSLVKNPNRFTANLHAAHIDEVTRSYLRRR